MEDTPPLNDPVRLDWLLSHINAMKGEKSKFAETVGLDPVSIIQMSNDKRKISDRTIYTIVSALGVSPPMGMVMPANASNGSPRRGSRETDEEIRLLRAAVSEMIRTQEEMRGMIQALLDREQ